MMGWAHKAQASLLIVGAHPDDNRVMLGVKHGEHEVVDVRIKRRTNGLRSVHDVGACGSDLVKPCARVRWH